MIISITENPDALALNESDIAKSVAQNISVLLRTRQGTVPMYREFGLPMEFLDKPANLARSLFQVEIREAIERFEPRARVTGVTFSTDPAQPGRLIPKVEVEIRDG